MRILPTAACWAVPCVMAFGSLAGLPEAAEYSAARGESFLLVWENGRTVYERQRDPGAPPPRIFSVTKSLVSIGVFRDAQAGGLSLATPAGHRAARGVCLADLLNQTSGLPPAQHEFYSEGLKDKQRVLDSLVRGDSGARFVYGPSHWEILAEEIAQRRGVPVERWLRRFVPGVKPRALARWTRDSRGRLFFSTGARMGAPELLPAGRAVLDGVRRGDWPRDVRSMLSSGTKANRMYALGFWLNRGAADPAAREINVETALGTPRGEGFWRSGCLSRAAPPDLLAMIGSRGQRVYVVPSRDLVVIRLGDGRGFADADFLRRLFGT